MSRRAVFREQYKIMPDEELREFYEQSKRIRRTLSMPVLLIFGISVYSVLNIISAVKDPAAEDLPILSILTLVSFAVSLISMTFIYSESARSHTVKVLISLLMTAVLAVVNLMIGPDYSLLIIQGSLFAGTLLINLLAHPVIKDIELLRSHPRFPFKNSHLDEAVLLRLKREDAAKFIGNTLDRNTVRSTGFEELFEGERKQIAEVETQVDPSEYMQQIKQMWMPHDKQDTAYTLDNIDKMYFDDGIEDGELKGEELERELRKATASSKPQEKRPEDFFQQSDMVWRSSKNDSGSRESRSTAPDEVKERSVLM